MVGMEMKELYSKMFLHLCLFMYEHVNYFYDSEHKP